MSTTVLVPAFHAFAAVRGKLTRAGELVNTPLSQCSWQFGLWVDNSL